LPDLFKIQDHKKKILGEVDETSLLLQDNLTAFWNTCVYWSCCSSISL